MKTYLYIKVNDQWKEVDMFNDISIPITLKVTDIRQFGSKSSGYSLDFDIPHTANNAILFGLNADIDVYRGSFEVGKDYEAYLSDGCFTTFQGQFRLKKVVKQNSGKYIFYVGYLYGGTKTFVDKLGTQTLTGNEDPNNDLNFSEYNTPAEEMTLSDFVSRLQMHDTSGEDWALTLIDKSNKYSQAFSSGSQRWSANECTPYLGAMGIFNRIISGVGYQYTSKFLMGNDGNTYLTGDDRWKDTIGKYDVYSLIYPYMRHNINITTVNPSSTELYQITNNSSSELFKTSIPTVEDYPFGEWFAINGTSNNYTVNFDSNNYNITNTGVNVPLATWRFVCPETGIYTINVNLPVKIKTQFYMDFYERIIVGPNKNTQNQTDQKFTYWISLMKNNRNIVQLAQTQNYPAHYAIDSYGWATLVPQQELSYSGNIMLAAGDAIQIYCAIQLDWYKERWYEPEGQYYKIYAFRGPEPTESTALRPVNITFEALHNSQTDSIIKIVENDGFYEEAAFSPQVILNPKTTKLEYFNEFVKMFNLYVEDVSGKKNYETGGIYPEKCLRIEPYECYYAPQIAQNDTNLKDWTDRIDWDVVEYMRIEDYLYNTQKFTKVQNKDYFNEQYDSTYILPYANRDIKGPYCTSDEKNEIELKTGGYLCGIVNQSTDTLQCPKVFSLDNSGNIDTKKEYSDGIFFIWRNYMNQNTDIDTNYTIKLESAAHPGTYQNVTNYFCADTLNKGYGLDDANLNWGPTDNYYQNMKGTKPTYNDLYSAFYKKQYEEYTDPDARIMKAKAYLTSFDIATVQLSDGIIIDDHLWRILEIKEWRDEKTPCEIELIKVLEGIYKPPVETPPGTNTNEPYVPIEGPEVIK